MKIEPSQITVFEKLQEVAAVHGKKIFLVGGYVRDLLMGKKLSEKDVDIVIEGDGIEFAGRCVSVVGGILKSFPSFGTAKIVKPSALPLIDEVDIASARSEQYASPGALPSVSLSRLEEDLKRRDFSMNAMALPVPAILSSFHNRTDEWREAIIDKFGGRADLETKQIKVLHERSFIDDPTRLYRAVRYRSRIGGHFEPNTGTLFKSAVKDGGLRTISTFRKMTEVRKLWEEENAAAALIAAYETALLEFLGLGHEIREIIEKAFLSGTKPSFDLFLREVLLRKSEDERRTFARENQLSNKKIKELLCDLPR